MRASDLLNREAFVRPSCFRGNYSALSFRDLSGEIRDQSAYAVLFDVNSPEIVVQAVLAENAKYREISEYIQFVGRSSAEIRVDEGKLVFRERDERDHRTFEEVFGY